MKSIFADLKVIDLSTVLAGPSVGTFFAELGADVLKIENPSNPDVTRSWKLPSEDHETNVGAYFSSVNYQKKYLSLDLKSEHDKSTLFDLLRTADILISNFKHGDDEKFGITTEELTRINPAIIWGQITGFGSESDRVAYDLILQAETGYMSMNGTAESGPVKMPVALIDVLAAHQLKEALLVALFQREKTGRGTSMTVSLYDAAICSLVNQASNYLMEDAIPKRIGSLHPNIAPYGEIFETSDGQLITFAVGNDRHFKKLCSLISLDSLADDARFSNNSDRVKNRVLLKDLLSEKIITKTSEEIANFCLSEFLPMGVIKSLKQVFEMQDAKKLIREENLEGRITKRVTQIAFQQK